MTLRPVVVVTDGGGYRDGHWQYREEGETGVGRRKVYAVILSGQPSTICSN